MAKKEENQSADTEGFGGQPNVNQSSLLGSVSASAAVQPKKRLILVVSPKGGPGKSTITIALYDALTMVGKVVSAFDAESAKTMTARILKDKAKHYTLISKGGSLRILDSLDSVSDVVLHDTGASSMVVESILTMLGKGPEAVDEIFSALEEANYRLTLVHAVSPSPDTVDGIEEWLDLVGNRADHVVVLNPRTSDTDGTFPYWHGFTAPNGESRGGTAKRRIEELVADGHAAVIEMPVLFAGTASKVELYGLRFLEALERHDLLTRAETSGVRVFLNSSAKGFSASPAGNFLGFN